MRWCWRRWRVGTAMFDTIKRLYAAGRLTEDGVQKAVKRGWITAAQYKEIVGEAYA